MLDPGDKVVLADGLSTGVFYDDILLTAHMVFEGEETVIFSMLFNMNNIVLLGNGHVYPASILVRV